MSHFGVTPLAAAASQSLVRFGQRTRPVESNPTVDGTAVRLVQNNPNRVEFTVVNLGTDSVFVSTSNQVSSSNGILIPANGGMTVLVEEDGEVAGYDWYVIANSGTQQLFVQEEVAD